VEKIILEKISGAIDLGAFLGRSGKKRFPFPIPIHHIPFLKERPSFLKVGWKKTRGQNSMSFSGVGEGGPNVCESQ